MKITKTLEAPRYVPATDYSSPFKSAFQLDADSVSLAELVGTRATWSIVLNHAPMFATFVNSPNVKPYLSTMSLDSFIAFGLITQSQIDAINTALIHLPRDQWPNL